LKTPEHQDGNRWLKPAEAAGLFGVDPRSLRNWARAGRINAQRTMGGHRRYLESEVRAHIAALRECQPVAATAEVAA
jgi:excisionase family DNA binding protein